MFQDWLNLYKKIYDHASGVVELKCPECGSISIDFQYSGDEERRVGYVAMWCVACNKGANLSRVSIPVGVPVIPFDAPVGEVAARIPDFKQVLL